MQRDQYFVVNHEDAWKIEHNGSHSEAFPTQRAAIDEARDRAKAAGDKGTSAQVLVQGENNSFREEWTYGRDPYPPKG